MKYKYFVAYVVHVEKNNNVVIYYNSGFYELDKQFETNYDLANFEKERAKEINVDETYIKIIDWKFIKEIKND